MNNTNGTSTRALVALLSLLAGAAAAPQAARAQAPHDPTAELERRIQAVMPKVVAWRRDIHQNPELSNREFRTAKLVAEHLKALGLEVRTEVAHTGVVGVLKGGRPGPVVALRADMDALPVTEEVDLPFASKVRAEFNGQQVGVMHACGHDNHVAILMGVAEVLSQIRKDLPGTVKFVFQPAEEGAPAGEAGGAALMIEQGVLESPRPDAIFGLHVFATGHTGEIMYRPGGIMASSDGLRIVVRGKQTHGALPWGGTDPIVVASQVVLGLQTVISRQTDLTLAPAIVTIGEFHGGVRGNIIPDSVVLNGTIRTFDPAVRKDVQARVRRTAENIAASAGASAQVTISNGASITYNDPALTRRMGPTLERVGATRVDANTQVTTTAEDFSFYQEKVPGLFFFLGATPPEIDLAGVPRNHSPKFFADEKALPVGVRALARLALDFLSGPATGATN